MPAKTQFSVLSLIVRVCTLWFQYHKKCVLSTLFSFSEIWRSYIGVNRGNTATDSTLDDDLVPEIDERSINVSRCVIV